MTTGIIVVMLILVLSRFGVEYYYKVSDKEVVLCENKVKAGCKPSFWYHVFNYGGLAGFNFRNGKIRFTNGEEFFFRTEYGFEKAKEKYFPWNEG